MSGDGATPLGPDERLDLIPTWVRTRADLDLAEADAIATVVARYGRRPPRLEDVLDDLALRRLHRDMFGAVWRWAGRYRTTARNLGVEAELIAPAVRDLVRDATVRFDTEEAVPVAAWFHHRLVAIHPFPDGNGRHARLATDLCLRALGHAASRWGRPRAGRSDGVDPTQVRARYLAALRDADRGDLGPLEEFLGEG